MTQSTARITRIHAKKPPEQPELPEPPLLPLVLLNAWKSSRLGILYPPLFISPQILTAITWHPKYGLHCCQTRPHWLFLGITDWADHLLISRTYYFPGRTDWRPSALCGAAYRQGSSSCTYDSQPSGLLLGWQTAFYTLCEYDGRSCSEEGGILSHCSLCCRTPRGVNSFLYLNW